MLFFYIALNLFFSWSSRLSQVSDKRVSRLHGLLENLDGQLRLKPVRPPAAPVVLPVVVFCLRSSPLVFLNDFKDILIPPAVPLSVNHAKRSTASSS